MRIISPAFKNGEKIPVKYTCDGRELSPPLLVEEVPAGAKSLALIAEDPDASGGTWIHWTVWNINPRAAFLEENEVPPGAIQGVTSAQSIGWHGPCPPSGSHRYFFRVWALDRELELPIGASVQDLRNEIKAHQIDSAEMFGVYERQ